MKTKTSSVLFIAVIALGLSFGLYYAKYFGSYAVDSIRRPWAYGSGDELLVGKWNGTFRDPAGVDKEITLEILVPVTDEQRAARASRRRKRTREDLRFFDGTAQIESSLGTENYEVSGSVDAKIDRRFVMNFGVEDENKRILPNYQPLRGSDGGWQGDTLTAQLTFVHVDADGVARTSSESVVVDGKLVDVVKEEDKPIELTLTRVP